MDAQQFQKSHPEIYDYAAENFAQLVMTGEGDKAALRPQFEIILDFWPESVSALPFVKPARAGSLNAIEREDSRARDVRLMYADTPKHGPTRQQRRHAAQKAAKSARA